MKNVWMIAPQGRAVVATVVAATVAMAVILKVMVYGREQNANAVVLRVDNRNRKDRYCFV
jgi:hypothetical protein